MLLSVRDLDTHYRSPEGRIRAVDGVSFDLAANDTLGLVGESGCGKTTVGRSLIGVLDDNAEIAGGEIRFQGRDLLSLDGAELRDLRWREIAIIPQSAMDALDPVYRVGDQMVEVLTRRGGFGAVEARRRSRRLFELVELSPDRLNDYPHEFSGGMKQRAIIATALALEPSLVIADEPVTALDVIVQHEILGSLETIQEELGLSIILITHDISVVAQFCRRLAVMYAGKVVESGPTRQVMKEPLHPYNLGLQNAFPNLKDPADHLVAIPGAPPRLVDPPSGCRFAGRCPFAVQKCREHAPELRSPEDDDHLAACHRLDIIDAMRQDAKDVSTWQDGR